MFPCFSLRTYEQSDKEGLESGNYTQLRQWHRSHIREFCRKQLKMEGREKLGLWEKGCDEK